MEDPNPNNEEEEEFHDAPEEFAPEDAIVNDESQLATSDLTISHDFTSPASTLRRRSHSGRKHLDIGSSSSSRGKRYIFYGKIRANEGEIEKTESTLSQLDDSVVNTDRVIDSDPEFFLNKNVNEGEIGNPESILSHRIDSIENTERVNDSVPEFDESSPNSLVSLAEFMIRAIGFQIKLLISLFTFPLKSLYHIYMFVNDPFHIVKRSKIFLMGKAIKLCGIVFEYVSPDISEWLKEQKSMWKLALKFGWGLLWASYVCVILCVLLVWAFLVSGVVMRYVVEEPMQMKETLNFDYTRSSPVAFVPVASCSGIACGGECRSMAEVGKGVVLSRVIPMNHKLQAIVSLTLPESDYNRNLGIFQVRVDFLSVNGKVLASMSRPSMLQYRSQPIRLLLTFFKIAPLVTGYSSESQILHVKIRGFTEGGVPTSCLKVVIEQRAEFRTNAGIPEIYAASLTLESELPLLKKLIWYWKKTLFVWIGMVLLMMELLIALLCCRPIIIPRVRTGDASSGRNVPQDQNQLA